ncbi:hypothetical protein J3R83DRAFT_4921 [Lanmaoa asiatica]|nr:hypothetical protein J3R83DRAFT_4921 [Lanmaoa asiatica]
MTTPSLPPWPSPTPTTGAPFGPGPLNSTNPPPPPPPPPPPGPTDTATANYIFGFVITLVVLLVLFVACGVGSWRRFRIIGTALDERLQNMEGSPFRARKRCRRRLVRPVFCETWTYPNGSLANPAPAPSEKNKWVDVQPISAAFTWSRSKSQSTTHKHDTLTPGRRDDGSGLGVGATLLSFVLPRPPRYDHPPRPPPPERRPPEAVQVAVMIAMPFPSSMASPVTDEPNYVGHSGVGEYEIGVVRIPWP